MSNGHIELPTRHLSARVAWHDTDWTGRVCATPASNHSCTVLRNIAGHKDADWEEGVAGQAWTSLVDGDVANEGAVPPCALERAGFMRTAPFTVMRTHAYAKRRNSSSHGHFTATAHRMAPYTIEAVPFRWMTRDSTDLRAEWDIPYHDEWEDAVDVAMGGFKSDWVQDHRNQRALLDSFTSALRPGASLVFFYAKDVPLLDDRPPGARVLIGVGRITDVDPIKEWDYSRAPAAGDVRAYMWERGIHHSVRPDFTDGFLLPYRALLDNPDLAGTDLTDYVAFAPAEHFTEFSYASEHVTDDAAIGALLELARVVDLLPGVADGPWDRVAGWLGDRIADTWKARGTYPGLGSALTAAGLERGALIAHRVIDALDDPTANPWPALEQAIADAAAGQGPAASLVGRMARKAWHKLTGDAERAQLLRLLARVPLSSTQARRMFDRDDRAGAGITATDAELIDNPYLLYELDRGRLDAVSLAAVDRSMFPRDADVAAALAADPIPDPVTEAGDDRRVRAASVHVLERAAEDGHTLLDEPGLRRRMANLELDPPCDPTSDVFDLAADEFPPTLRETALARDRGRGWQLDRLADAGDLIAAEIADRAAAGPLDVEWDWRECIDKAIDQPAEVDDVDEQAARTEKAQALQVLARSRAAVLVGPAGTGKTTMLRALCSHPDVQAGGVLLLAPTGKARVQLGDKTGVKALTIAQFLRTSGRWHHERGYRTNPDASRHTAAATLVIDESSMLTEEMLAAVLDGVAGVDRLILAGDHRQLPPIGPGRPFADLVAHLRDREADVDDAEPDGAGLATLTVSRRQVTAPAGADQLTRPARDDLAVASWFSVDGRAPAADEALARVLAGDGDGTLTVISWDDEEDLHGKVVGWLGADPDLAITDDDALRTSLGASMPGKYGNQFAFGEGGAGAENWQLLSLVRHRRGGTVGLNRIVRHTWRDGDTTKALRSRKMLSPAGADEILFNDKVMVIDNHSRPGWHVADGERRDGSVANGEIGMVVKTTYSAGFPAGLTVELSTQPGLQFTFWESQLNATSDRARELLGLAYAITVHKAQGSQFATTLVVIPNPCVLLSPEMLYTALTRQRERTVVFIQDDPADLRLLGAPERSATARRLTRLFTAADPFTTADGIVYDDSHAHRTLNGEMVTSKSEVIVANVLRDLDVTYEYETLLVMDDGTQRLPDFTIRRTGKPTVYWEHLGMLSSPGYRANWEAKQRWYADHGVLPWTEGGGPAGVLITSEEGRGIDQQAIHELARDALDLPAGS